MSTVVTTSTPREPVLGWIDEDAGQLMCELGPGGQRLFRARAQPPLSGAGSCRPSPDRQSEATSADRGRRAVRRVTVAGSEVCCCSGVVQCWLPQRLV